ALEEAVVEALEETHRGVGGQAEADDGVARDPGHGRDVGEVDRKRLPPEQPRRRPLAAEVHALDEAVAADEGLAGRLDARGVGPDPDDDPVPRGDPSPEIPEKLALAQLGDRSLGIDPSK